jgi:hypothetical protein
MNFAMKKLPFGLVAVFGTVVMSLPVQAANDTATATADIYAAITITQAANMDFGVLTPAAGGTVTLNGDNTLTLGGAATATGGTPSAAEFAIGGQGSAGYTIDTSASSVNLTSGANTMAISYTAYSFNADNAYATPAAGSATLSAGGADTLRIGADLAVGAAQAAGTYTGTVDVTVAYQ